MRLQSSASHLIIGIIALAVMHSIAQAAPLDIRDAIKTRKIGTALEYLEDRTGALALNDVRGGKAEDRWKKSEKKRPGLRLHHVGLLDPVYPRKRRREGGPRPGAAGIPPD